MTYTQNLKKFGAQAMVLVTIVMGSFNFSPARVDAKGLDLLNLLAQTSTATAVESTLVTMDTTDLKFPVAKPRPAKIGHTVHVVATAYSSDPNQTDDSPCNGAMWSYNLCEHYLQDGEENTIAANFLPLGTKIRFPDLYGDKVFVVRDRMNARYNYDTLGYYRIDFYKAAANEDGTQMDSKAAKRKAIQFGIKHNLKMEILSA